MRAAIETDPATGLKIFNTRAAPASDRIGGKGLAVVADPALKTMPDPPAETTFGACDKERYRQFTQARRGSGDWASLEGELARYLDDPYSAAPVERAALDDTCEILVIGAGFSGLILWQKLQAAGFKDVRYCEKGGDVGGTWYWNRYPGIACDVESYCYLPLLEETGYVPSMRYASGFEIMEHCQRIATQFGLYDHCLFHTTVEEARWDEAARRWTVKTDRGDAMKARFVILANGILTTPKLARIRGMERFKGAAFHSSRWNYDVDLKGKRIGVIGTGATGVQLVPELAKSAAELYVFQRTPSTVDVRDQRETTAEERCAWAAQPGWSQARRARFARMMDWGVYSASDDYMSGKVEWEGPRKDMFARSPEDQLQARLDDNFRIMERLRARVDAVVRDPKTAAALKGYYAYACKRPTFHDEYLPAFNAPNVHLVDTSPTGVGEINETGVLHAGVQYPLDVLVYATGFQWMTAGMFERLVGRDGRGLAQKWQAEGTRTFLGLHSHGFPNLMIVAGPQGGGRTFNFTDVAETHADYVVWMLKTIRDRGGDFVDVRSEDEQAYSEHCRQADLETMSLRDCVSYYNNYGTAEPGALGYYGGERWFAYRDEAQATLAPFVFEADGREPPCRSPRDAALSE